MNEVKISEDYYEGGDSEMNPIIQKDSTGCGLACVAMVLGKTYNQIKQQAQEEFEDYPSKKNKYRTDDKQLCKLFSKSNIRLGKKLNFKDFSSLPALALLATKYKEKEGGDEWHWVIYQRNKNKELVFDPNDKLKSVKRTSFKVVGKKCKWYFSITNT